jgi:hypothetical protein
MHLNPTDLHIIKTYDSHPLLGSLPRFPPPRSGLDATGLWEAGSVRPRLGSRWQDRSWRLSPGSGLTIHGVLSMVPVTLLRVSGQLETMSRIDIPHRFAWGREVVCCVLYGAATQLPRDTQQREPPVITPVLHYTSPQVSAAPWQQVATAVGISPQIPPPCSGLDATGLWEAGSVRPRLGSRWQDRSWRLSPGSGLTKAEHLMQNKRNLMQNKRNLMQNL